MITAQSRQDKPDSTASFQKRRVYFNEFNVLMENAAYFPLVSGLLRAHAETSELLRANYDFMPFLFCRDSPEHVVAQYDNPSVAAFSVSVWNEQINLRTAEQVKCLYPDCLIVFGGPQVPHYPEVYFDQHPFIDVAVRGEGEGTFSEILTRFLISRNFSEIPSVAYRNPGTGICVRNEAERPLPRDLDIYPSPYLEGLFEDLFVKCPDLEFQAVVETSRGCPFHCTYCFWGQGGLSKEYRYHSLERVAAEIQWCGTHQIKYVFNADSNFGIHSRDMQIAHIFVEAKKRYGYPEKFRSCFTKNTDDKVCEIAMLLHQHRLEKGITMSFQSMNPQVLQNIKRKNIRLSTYENFLSRFNEMGIPVYSELILGLPGENYQTWTTGIEEMLRSGLVNQFFSYFCEVYPNTDLADPLYQKRFGIVTKRIVLTEIHSAIHQDKSPPEYQEIIIATNSMPLAEWRKMAVFSWVTMLLHSMKLGFFILAYLVNRYGIRYVDLISYISECRMPPEIGKILREEVARFETQLDRLLKGHGRGHEMPEFGGIYWDEEEASFLRISDKIDQFYDEMLVLLCEFLNKMDIPYDNAELAEVVQYQRVRIPSCHPPTITEWGFNFNFPEYFETYFYSNPVSLKAKSQILTLYPKDYQGDKIGYARETILWGRKSDALLTNVKWRDDITKAQ